MACMKGYLGFCYVLSGLYVIDSMAYGSLLHIDLCLQKEVKRFRSYIN